MPFVNMKLSPDGLTKEKKKALISGVTNLLAEELGKDPATVVVIIEAIDTDNYGFGGESVTDRRARLSN